ncbi:hypothetical protein SRHO_G00002120 [Serrasalmus rhombeus]
MGRRAGCIPLCSKSPAVLICAWSLVLGSTLGPGGRKSLSTQRVQCPPKSGRWDRSAAHLSQHGHAAHLNVWRWIRWWSARL